MFTGRQLDEETGLYFYRARYYDPVKGRFLQRDPLGYVDGMNLYAAYFVPGNTDAYGKDVTWLSVSIRPDPEEEEEANTFGVNFSAVYVYKGDSCDCCKLVYWRQYAKSSYSTNVFELFSTSKGGDWHLDGGNPAYPYQEMVIPSDRSQLGEMHDTPSITGPFITNFGQDFMTQLICINKVGKEVALTDPILWGHAYSTNLRPNGPTHEHYPKGRTINPKIHTCEEAIAPSKP